MPLDSQELSNTAKFLNQVSDYSFSLSRKTLDDNGLSDEDLKNLSDLHKYSVDMKNILNQLSNEINEGNISWGELTKKGRVPFAQEVSNLSKDSFSNVEENFTEYAGLIYDGAFSEHLTSPERKGLTGEIIDEENAKNIAKKILGNYNIEELNNDGFVENGNIAVYTFSTNIKESKDYISISISQKGGHLVYLNYNREITQEIISQDEANQKGKEYLASIGFENMKETYFLKQEGTVTINYAYNQNDVIVYSDLIKVKVALDNGEILGVETTGYLNSHEKRDLANVKVSKEKAKEKLNKNLQIKSEGLAVIPTKWQTEIFCWEFKGIVEEREFLVYINVETGEEEDILMIINTPNGTATL